MQISDVDCTADSMKLKADEKKCLQWAALIKTKVYSWGRFKKQNKKKSEQTNKIGEAHRDKPQEQKEDGTRTWPNQRKQTRTNTHQGEEPNKEQVDSSATNKSGKKKQRRN